MPFRSVRRSRLLAAIVLATVPVGVLVPAPQAAAHEPPGIDASVRIQATGWQARTLDTRLRQAARSLRELRRAAELQPMGKSDLNPIDITHTFVSLDVDEAAGTIDADIQLTIQALEGGLARAEFYLLPLSQFAVTDGAGAPLSFTVNAAWSTVEVDLPIPLAAGEQLELRFTQQGRPNCEPDPYFQMTMCRYGSDIVFDTGPAWLPTKAAYDYLTMYTTGTIDLDIVTPPAMTAVTTSPLESVDDLGDRLVHHFRGSLPTSYPSLAYAPFSVANAPTSDGKPVAALVHTGTTQYAQAWADISADVIDYFGEIYTPYLYAKQDVIQTIDELGGGVGPPSATFYYASALTTDPTTPFAESIFAHEIGHSWWANMIRLGDVYSPWLAEGFAEYSARAFGYQVRPPRYGNYMFESSFRGFQFYATPETEVPLTGPGIYTDDSLLYFYVTYYKGSHLVRMLQWLLGDEAFFDAMADYSAGYVWTPQKQVLVDVPALQGALEAASGRDLASFFDQWVYSTGYPVYRWASQFDPTPGGGWTARVRIEQVQETEQVYELPIEVRLWIGDEEEPRTYRAEFVGKVAELEVALDAEPRGLRVDDAYWIWGDKIPALVGDADGSNEVDGLDLIYMGWAQGGRADDYEHGYNYLAESDLDRSGVVDGEDLDMLKANFGRKGTIQ